MGTQAGLWVAGWEGACRVEIEVEILDVEESRGQPRRSRCQSAAATLKPDRCALG